MTALGENHPTSETKYKLNTVLKNRWSSIIREGLSKDKKLQLLAKYTSPSNFSLLTAQILIRKLRPLSLVNELAGGISALGQALNHLLDKERAVHDKNVIVTQLSDAGRLFTDTFHSISISRRASITPLLNKTVKDATANTLVDVVLFGDNL